MNPVDAQKALILLGVMPSDLERLRHHPVDHARTLLEQLKTRARQNYKRMALELHPDRTGGDQVKSDLFVLLGRVLEDLNKVTVQAPPQVVSYTYHIPRVPWVNARWSNTATTPTTTTMGFGPQQVTRIVKMRPR